jgi:hypothetical protein
LQALRSGFLFLLELLLGSGERGNAAFEPHRNRAGERGPNAKPFVSNWRATNKVVANTEVSTSLSSSGTNIDLYPI